MQVERLAVAAAEPLAALRAATHALHDAIEARSGLIAATRSRADYVAHLAAMRGWIGELQPAAAAGHAAHAFAVAFAGRNRLRCALIDADLADLGYVSTAALGAVPPPPDAAECAAIYGVAYVVEGAQLGRAAVRRAVDGFALGAATRYLAHRDSYGWPAFLAELGRAVADRAAVEVACRAAVHTFMRFSDWAEAARPKI